MVDTGCPRAGYRHIACGLQAYSPGGLQAYSHGCGRPDRVRLGMCRGGTQTTDVCFAAGCGDQMLGGKEECRSQAARSSGSWFSRFYRLAIEGRRQREAFVHGFRGCLI
jgi:hypothetical protein